MTKNTVDEQTILKLIVNEVREARELYEIVSQLQTALPIKSVVDIKKVLGEKGKLKFRDTTVSMGLLENMIPKIVFPIENIESLVERAGQLIRLMPPYIGYDQSTLVKEHMRTRGLGVAPNGFPNSNSFSMGSGFPNNSNVLPDHNTAQMMREDKQDAS